jgi:hypothetical protein
VVTYLEILIENSGLFADPETGATLLTEEEVCVSILWRKA